MSASDESKAGSAWIQFVSLAIALVALVFSIRSHLAVRRLANGGRAAGVTGTHARSTQAQPAMGERGDGPTAPDGMAGGGSLPPMPGGRGSPSGPGLEQSAPPTGRQGEDSGTNGSEARTGHSPTAPSRWPSGTGTSADEGASQMRLLELRSRLLAEDVGHHGTKIVEALARSRADGPRHGGEQGGDSEEAFVTLVGGYPDSYAAAVAIAERALDAVWESRAKDVECFYQLLLKDDGTYAESIVTESGVEAVPVIQDCLIRHYIGLGSVDKAEALLETLTKNHAGSRIGSLTDENKIVWRSAVDVIEGHRRSLRERAQRAGE